MDTLFQSPPIIENIFKHLCFRDLCSCAQVCKLWKSMSAVELEQRRKIDYFFQTAENDHIKTLEHDGIECAFGEELKKQLNCLRIKSSFCIAFASESLMYDCGLLFSSLLPDKPFLKRQRTCSWLFTRGTDHSVKKYVLAAHLPPRSKCMYVVAPGVIGCCSDNTSVEVEDGYTITGFCLPEMPGVEIESYDILRHNFEDILSEDNKAKCLLVFDSCADTLRSKLSQILDKRLKRNPNLAIGGASLRHSSKVVVISGENVEAASLIIRKQDDKKELKNKLKLFGETGLLKNQCFAFMFACVARGYDFHKEHNFESSAFHSLYPKVPLIGVFGEGEVGVNFLPSNGTTPSKKFPGQRKYFYSYSTVFVLVSIKD